MRPIRLEIEGFTSFRRRAELCFDGLDLFVITGPTGAGKSSLLDAMLYALYGRTARAGEKEINHVINLGARTMKVLLEFSAGAEQYRVTRTAKLVKGAVNTELRLERILAEGHEALAGKVREVNARIEQILGLDFDGFTRAVILPQGKFDEFLRGDAAKRRQILEDLLRLEAYKKMGQRARERVKESRTRIGMLETELATTYGEVTEATKSAAESDLELLCKGLDVAAGELAAVEELLPAALELRSQRTRRTEESARATAAHADAQRAKEGVERGAVDAEQMKARLEETDRLIRDCGFDEPLYEQLLQLAPVAEQRTRAASEVAIRQKTHAEALAKLPSLEEAARGAADAHQRGEAKLAAAGERRDIAKSDAEALHAKHGSADRIRDLAKEAKDLKRLGDDKRRIEKQVADLNAEAGRLDDALAKLRVEDWETEAAVQRARETLEHLQRMHAADELRAHLEAGDPCPVCEQTVADPPPPRESDSLDEAKQEVAKAESDRRRCLDELAGKQKERESIPKQIEVVKQNWRRVDEQAGAIAKKTAQALGRTPGQDPEAELKALAAIVAKADADVDAAAKSVDQARAEESAAKEAVSRRQREVESARQIAESVESALASERTRLAEIEERLAAWPQFTLQLKQQQEAKKRRDALTGERQRQERTLRDAEQAGIEKQKAIIVYLERARAAEAAAQAAAEQIRLLEEKLKALHGLDEAAHLEARRNQLRTALADLDRRRTLRQADIERLTRMFVEATEKRAGIEDMKQEAAVYQALASSLEADQFQAYVQREALGRLAVNGSLHLRQLSQGRYSLALAGDGNGFEVVDHHNANETRPASTLSGGESFLASLALALGLAESLSEYCVDREKLALESLFLDEGFSTLDPETLQVVVDAIEALADGKRMVGVISHVPELAERLPVRIHVEKGSITQPARSATAAGE